MALSSQHERHNRSRNSPPPSKMFTRRTKGEIKNFPVDRLREVRVIGNPHFFEKYALACENANLFRTTMESFHAACSVTKSRTMTKQSISLSSQLANKPGEPAYVFGQAASSSGATLQAQDVRDH